MTRSLTAPRLGPSLAALLLLGCASSFSIEEADAGPPPIDAACELGEALPAEVVGHFTFVEPGCRREGPWPGDDWVIHVFWVDWCGDAGTLTLDGRDSTGRARRVGDGFRYETSAGPTGRPFAFEFRALGRGGDGAPALAVESVAGAPSYFTWGLRIGDPDGDTDPSEVPVVRACAERESWSAHELTRSGAGRRLGQGEATLVGLAASRVEMSVERPGEIQIRDPRLMGLPGEARFHSRVRDWDAAAGVGRFGWPLQACTELDGQVEVEWNGARLVTRVDWLVRDTEDLDRDGDREELLVRRTRTESRPEACP